MVAIIVGAESPIVYTAADMIGVEELDVRGLADVLAHGNDGLDRRARFGAIAAAVGALLATGRYAHTDVGTVRRFAAYKRRAVRAQWAAYRRAMDAAAPDDWET